MSLAQWAENGWLRPHKTSRKEITNLFAIVDRDLLDAKRGISSDWQFGIAYNAALKLCTILLYAEGYRPEGAFKHYRPIRALPLILGPERKADADYLDACRKKRNIVEYEYVGDVTDDDVEELIRFIEGLKREVEEWLKDRRSDLLHTKRLDGDPPLEH
jgi:hypothetical protein